MHGLEAVAVTAPTGIAAINVEGVTIHSFAGIGISKSSFEKTLSRSMKTSKNKKRWQKTKVLIIDEVSMVEPKLFTLIEETARVCRGNNEPFGGIQIIVLGDFLQLPPVEKPKNGQKWNNSIKYL